MRWRITTSPTKVSGSRRCTSTGSGSPGSMPSGVALTTRSKPAGSRSPVHTLSAGYSASRRPARASAAVGCRSNRASRVAPAAASEAAMAEPTPPLPTTSADAPCSFRPLRCRPRTKPSPSNMSPTRRPSGSRRTALQAPATRAVGDTASSRPITLTLSGMVMSAPRTLSAANSARSSAGNSGTRQARGTTTALMRAAAKYGL